MKAIITAAAIAALGIGAAHAQGAYVTGSGHNLCLVSWGIDHTSTVDKGKAIVFHMKDGTAWRNTLAAPCPGLNFHGFVYVTHTDNICSNMQSISVIETHEVCMLGAFTPEAPPPAKTL
jgi:hypothetical protein